MPSKDKRKLAAIMFADVVGYSRMMASNEERTLELLKDFENICSPIISKHDGEIIKKVGDELFCEFSSAKQAVDCALAIQEVIQTYNDSRPKDFKLQVRIGIHVGDIVLRDGDVFGDGVNVAKRLEGMAPEGGICVSNSVYDELRNKKEFDGIDLGLQTLKGIGRLVEVFGLKGNKLNAPNPSNYRENKVQVHTHDEVPSVAIIPFRNKGKEEEEFYAYGICSELISDVSSAGLIRVASLEKIIELGELSASEKARELNVRYITTGMLWKMEDMFQLSIELYDTKDTKVIWSDQWQEHWDNLSTIKGNLSAGLLKAFNTKNNICASVARVLSGFNFCSSSMALMPMGVAALSSPSILAARFMVTAPWAGWLAGTSGIILANSGCSPLANTCTSPAFSAKRKKPIHRLMTPIRPKAIFAASSALENKAFTMVAKMSVLPNTNH